jgi:hypothetical protein
VQQRHQIKQEIRGSVVEGSAVPRARRGNVFLPRGADKPAFLFHSLIPRYKAKRENCGSFGKIYTPQLEQILDSGVNQIKHVLFGTHNCCALFAFDRNDMYISNIGNTWLWQRQRCLQRTH